MAESPPRGSLCQRRPEGLWGGGGACGEGALTAGRGMARQSIAALGSRPVPGSPPREAGQQRALEQLLLAPFGGRQPELREAELGWWPGGGRGTRMLGCFSPVLLGVKLPTGQLPRLLTRKVQPGRQGVFVCVSRARSAPGRSSRSVSSALLTGL